MRGSFLQKSLVTLLIVFACITGIFAQGTKPPQSQEQDLSADEEYRVIGKHLPDWQNVQNRAVYISNSGELRTALGNRGVFDLITFEGGTEAVTANYDAGKLLIVEYTTPQFSIDADNRVKQFLTENPQNPPVYARRVGNYEVFVFDSTNEAAANELISQVKYEKNVQWLGQDPHLYQRYEKAYMKMTSEVFISTIISIVLGISLAVGTGIAVGLTIFYMRKQKLASMTAFSDAGGMTRLNLDDLTSETSADRLLKD